MRRYETVARLVGFLLLGVFTLGLLLWAAWETFLVRVFKLVEISYLDALGLAILVALLFGAVWALKEARE